MHELAVTENIRDIAVRYAREANATRITDLFLVMGELSSIVDESVQFYWDFIAEGSIAEGATLHFRRIPAEIVCQDCGHSYSPQQALTCPACDSSNVRVVAGEEFYLEAIEVADEANEPATERSRR